jgi:hypothetical protein
MAQQFLDKSKIGLFLLVAMIISNCNDAQRDCGNSIRDFDSIAVRQINLQNLNKNITPKDSSIISAWVNSDSSANVTQESTVLNIVWPYYVKSYTIQSTGLRFSLVKDGHDSIHLIAHSQMRDWEHNLNSMYSESVISHRAFKHPINGLRLRDSIRVVRLDTSPLRFIERDLNPPTGKPDVISLGQAVDIIRAVYKPFMNQLVGFVDLDTYLSKNKELVAKNCVFFVEQVKNSSSYRYAGIFRGEDRGFFLVIVGESSDVAIYFIPLIEVPKTFW